MALGLADLRGEVGVQAPELRQQLRDLARLGRRRAAHPGLVDLLCERLLRLLHHLLLRPQEALCLGGGILREVLRLQHLPGVLQDLQRLSLYALHACCRLLPAGGCPRTCCWRRGRGRPAGSGCGGSSCGSSGCNGLHKQEVLSRRPIPGDPPALSRWQIAVCVGTGPNLGAADLVAEPPAAEVGAISGVPVIQEHAGALMA
mmetsp:Transcript_88631/g.275545  ORF Transcript_88631/g.275545 Transcript_88631/m.275545 type:complete len:202 (-) Transcript_88631:191-796(-)